MEAAQSTRRCRLLLDCTLPSMPLSLKSHRLGVATASLGMNAIHTLETRFAALRKAGFAFCEVGFGDYIAWVRSQSPHLYAMSLESTAERHAERQPALKLPVRLGRERGAGSRAAGDLDRNVPPGATPDRDRQGVWPSDSHAPALEPVRRMASRPPSARLGTEKGRAVVAPVLLAASGNAPGECPPGWSRKTDPQVGSNNLHEANAPDETRAGELRWLADFASKLDPPVMIAYEQWCFGEVIATWERCWEIVKLAVSIRSVRSSDTSGPPKSRTVPRHWPGAAVTDLWVQAKPGRRVRRPRA